MLKEADLLAALTALDVLATLSDDDFAYAMAHTAERRQSLGI